MSHPKVWALAGMPPTKEELHTKLLALAAGPEGGPLRRADAWAAAPRCFQRQWIFLCLSDGIEEVAGQANGAWEAAWAGLF